MTEPAAETPRPEPQPGSRAVEVDRDGGIRESGGSRRDGVPFLVAGGPHPALAALDLDERLILLERAARGLHAAHCRGWIHGGLRGGTLRRIEGEHGDRVLVGGFTARPGASVGGDLLDFAAIIGALCSEEVPARGALRRDFDAVCAACAARESGYPSAAHLAEDLERLRRGHAVVARPVGPTGRLLRIAARRPMLATALSIAGASALIALVGGVARAREVETDRVRLRSQAERTLALLHDLDDHVGTGDIRDRLAATLLEHAEVLAGNDEASRRMLVEAIIRAGTLARERNRPDDARMLRDRAVAEAESLASTWPGSFDARRLLAHALIVQGDLAKEGGDAETAASRYERALAIEESLLAERPTDGGQILRTGWGYERCAFLDARRPDGALLAIARLNRAEELVSRLLAIDRTDAEARWLSLMIRRHHIDLLDFRGASEDAATLRAETVAELRELAAAAGASRRFTTALAHWLAGEALRHASAGRQTEAMAAAGEAVRTIGQAAYGDGGSIDSESIRLWIDTVVTRVGLPDDNGAGDAAPPVDPLARLRALEAGDPRVAAFLRAFEDALADLVRPSPDDLSAAALRSPAGQKPTHRDPTHRDPVAGDLPPAD